MHAFWAKGYEATSLADLMSATGLHKGSLYQAFGDKHSLFLASLRRYLDDMHHEMSGIARTAETPREALHALAHTAVNKINTDCGCPMGCLAINSLVEMAPHDEEVRDMLSDHLERMTTQISQLVAAGQAAGEFSDRHSPTVVTEMMTTFLSGLGCELKGPLSKERAHELIDLQFEMLI